MTTHQLSVEVPPRALSECGQSHPRTLSRMRVCYWALLSIVCGPALLKNAGSGIVFDHLSLGWSIYCSISVFTNRRDDTVGLALINRGLWKYCQYPLFFVSLVCFYSFFWWLSLTSPGCACIRCWPINALLPDVIGTWVFIHIEIVNTILIPGPTF